MHFDREPEHAQNYVDRRPARCLLVPLVLGVLFFSYGCDAYHPAKTQSWSVGPYEITEEIQRSRNDWPDPTFRTRYWLARDGQNFLIATEHSESSQGITSSPQLIDDFVIIASGSHFYRMGADHEVKKFSPWKTNQWEKHLQSLGIAESYYQATAESATHAHGAWTLSYALTSESLGIQQLQFTSTDDWKTFQLDESSPIPASENP